jgi:hypothetical protein
MITWDEHRGKYGELGFVASRLWRKRQYHIYIAFDDETRAGDAWHWSISEFPAESNNWKDSVLLVKGTASSLYIAKVACEWFFIDKISGESSEERPRLVVIENNIKKGI